MTNADKILPTWEVVLDDKVVVGRCVASNTAEALRWAIRQNPALRKRLTVRREVAE